MNIKLLDTNGVELMNEVVQKVIAALKGNFDEYDVCRNSGRRHYRRPTNSPDMSKCLDYSLYKYFTFDGQDFCLYVTYRLLDIEYNDLPVKAEHIEYRVQDTRSYPRGFSFKKDQVQSFEKYLDGFDSNSKEFKEYLKDELTNGGFPQHIIDTLLNADLSEGFLYHQPYNMENLRDFSLVADFDPELYKDKYMVMFDKTWHSMDNYSRHDDYLADFLETFDITLSDQTMKLTEWIAENCHGKVTIFGNSYAWYIIIFEDKNDAMMYKMTWQ